MDTADAAGLRKGVLALRDEAIRVKAWVRFVIVSSLVADPPKLLGQTPMGIMLHDVVCHPVDRGQGIGAEYVLQAILRPAPGLEWPHVQLSVQPGGFMKCPACGHRVGGRFSVPQYRSSLDRFHQPIVGWFQSDGNFMPPSAIKQDMSMPLDGVIVG